MEAILIVAIEMIILAICVLLFLSYIGYDLRSRGFNGTFAVTVMHQNEISFSDYFKRRKEHPVLDGQYENCKMARLYLATMIVGLLILILLPFTLVSY